METLKILITGVSGFIGSNIAHQLVSENHEVYGISRNPDLNWRLSDIKKELIYVPTDISVYKDLRNSMVSIKPDGIIHCAQYGAYPNESGIRDAYSINLTGLFNILEVSSEFNTDWLINSGTSFEYSGSTHKLSEGIKTKPRSYYGVFKSAATNLLSLYSGIKKIKLVTLRIFQAYGPYEARGRLAPYVVYNLIENGSIRLNNPHLRRDFVYVKDVTSAVEKTIRAVDKFSEHEIFNIGSGKSRSIKDFVQAGKKVLHSSSEIILGNSVAKPEDSVHQLVANNNKAINILGWKPDYDIAEGIKDFSGWLEKRIDYYKQ